MRKRTVELIVMLALAMVALWDGFGIIRGSGQYAGGLAGGFQVLVASLLVLSAIAYWMKTQPIVVDWGAVAGDPMLRRVLVGFVLFLAYVALMPVLGYMLASTLAFIVYLRIYSNYRWAPLLAGSLMLGVGSAYLWAWLETGLPQGVVPWP